MFPGIYLFFEKNIPVLIFPVPSLVLVKNYALFPMDIEVSTDLPVFEQNYLYQYYLYPPLFW